MITQEPTTVWRVHEDGRWIECILRLVPVGVNAEIVRDGTLLYSRVFGTGDDAMLWAEEERALRVPCE